MGEGRYLEKASLLSRSNSAQWKTDATQQRTYDARYGVQDDSQLQLSSVVTVRHNSPTANEEKGKYTPTRMQS